MEITKNVTDGGGRNIPAKKLMDAKVRPQLLKFVENILQLICCILREFLEPMPAIQADDPFGFEKALTVEQLFKARVHFGHKVFIQIKFFFLKNIQIGTLNENMKWAIYGGYYFINLIIH